MAEGVAAVFHCQHATADAIGWRLNGTTLLGSTLDGVAATTSSVADGILNTLITLALPQLKLNVWLTLMTLLQCTEILWI